MAASLVFIAPAGSTANRILDHRQCLRNTVGKIVCEEVDPATSVGVGAGTLGWEYLKLLTLMGMGEISISDDDTVQEPNLAS